MKRAFRSIAIFILIFSVSSTSSVATIFQSQSVLVVRQSQITNLDTQFLPKCKKTEYKNSNGVCVKKPKKASNWPDGASAKCWDGTFSFSQSRRGTCSRHGGVQVWR